MVTVTAVENVKNLLEAVPGLRLAVLFGSTARGQARRGSDIDIGLSMAPGLDVPPLLQVSLERAAGRQVSITRLDDAPPLLRFEIGRDGVVLVEREHRAWAGFRAQAMIDWWDWAPTARMMHRVMARRLREEAGRGPA
jgi:predicted nucleotidyltransferase